MRKTWLAAITAAASLVHAPVAAATQCLNTDEVAASRVYNLNTRLMIEALKCADTIPKIRDVYDAFADSHRDLIVGSKLALQAYFVRSLGLAPANEAFTRYETSLGNALSTAPASYDRCEQMMALTRLATVAAPDDLIALSPMVAADAAIPACPGVAERRAMVVEVWERGRPGVKFGDTPDVARSATLPAVRPKVAHADAVIPVSGTSAPVQAPIPATQSVAAEAAAAVPKAEPASGPADAAQPVAASQSDPADALRQAADALARAAAALKR